MKSCSIFFLLLIFASQLHCQIITGKVLDASNGLPLEYVSIGIVETSFGTLTNEKGVFSLEVKGQSSKAQVRFSIIGFKSQTFTIAELTGETNIIKLKNEPIQLAEVIIKPTGKEKKVGTTNYTLFGGYCGWLGTDFGKGYEIGTQIVLGTLPVKLKSLHIHVNNQSFDSSLFRLHIRDIVDNLPINELLTANIFISIAKKSGWVDIDLSKYHLIFNGVVALSLEWIKVSGIHKEKPMKKSGSKQDLASVRFSIKTKKGCSFSKWGSEAKWSRLDSESPSFYLTVQE